MATAIDLVDLGMPWTQARANGFQIGSVTAAGTTAGGAASSGSMSFINLVTDTNLSGLILNPLTPYSAIVIVFVASAVTGNVFPPTGGTINGGTATTGSVAIAQNTVRVFTRYDATKWFSILTA